MLFRAAGEWTAPENYKLMHRYSNSGYDFGYLLKIVSCAALPPTEAEFFELLRIWFPCIWDIKARLSSLLFLLCARPISCPLGCGQLGRAG